MKTFKEFTNEAKIDSVNDLKKAQQELTQKYLTRKLHSFLLDIYVENYLDFRYIDWRKQLERILYVKDTAEGLKILLDIHEFIVFKKSRSKNTNIADVKQSINVLVKNFADKNSVNYEIEDDLAMLSIQLFTDNERGIPIAKHTGII